MKQAVFVSLIVAASAIPLVQREYHVEPLHAILERDPAVRAYDENGQYIDSSDGCWFPDCNDYTLGGVWTGDGPKPYSPEWFAQNGIGTTSSTTTTSDTAGSETMTTTGTPSSGSTTDTSSGSTPSDASVCQSECQPILSASNECTTSTDPYCGCHVLLSNGNACANCLQPINSTVSAIIISGMQTCQSHSSTSSQSSGSQGGNLPSATMSTGSKPTGSVVAGSATTSAAKTSATGIPVLTSSASRFEASFTMVVILIFGGVFL
jgi:hypothetical protein